MAANNYFGFTPGGTQYGTATNPTPNYSTQSQATAGYTVQHSAQPYAAAATAQRSSQSYEGYQQQTQAAAASYQYPTRQSSRSASQLKETANISILKPPRKSYSRDLCRTIVHQAKKLSKKQKQITIKDKLAESMNQHFSDCDSFELCVE